MAFYKNGEIKRAVPRVTDTVESITLTEEAVENHADLSVAQREELLTAVRQLNEEDAERYGDTQKVIFLQDGEELDNPIKNDKTASNSDRTVAFVQGHRYVSFSKLRESPRYTTELEE